MNKTQRHRDTEPYFYKVINSESLCLCVLIVLIALTAMGANAINLSEVKALGLPVVVIETVDHEEPTCDYVFAPEGAFGISITNATRVPGRVVLLEHGDTLFDSGPYLKDASGMTLRIRGNTTAYYSDKKPFKIKLERKGDMLARGSETYYDKNWVLIRDGNDIINAMVGNMVNELVGMTYTPAFRYVNVIVNGDYRGIYMLTETVRRNADCRLNVNRQCGYIIECDAYWWNEDLYFQSSHGKYFTFKYPESEDVTPSQLNYISTVIEDFEQSLATGQYAHHIDLNSFARWLLAHDILGTGDSGGSNMYLSKYDDSDTTKLQMTTLWDFGSAMRNVDYWASVHFDFFYYTDLFANQNPDFTRTYCDLWQQLEPTIFDELIRRLQAFLASPTAQALQASRPYETERWQYEAASVEENVNTWVSWLSERRNWLSTAISTLGIQKTPQNALNSATAVYSLSGQRVSAPLRPGLYIVNGRKVAIK